MVATARRPSRFRQISTDFAVNFIDIMTFSAVLAPFCEESTIGDDFPHKRISNEDIWYFLSRANKTNTRVLGDLRRHGAYVTSL